MRRTAGDPKSIEERGRRRKGQNPAERDLQQKGDTGADVRSRVLAEVRRVEDDACTRAIGKVSSSAFDETEQLDAPMRQPASVPATGTVMTLQVVFEVSNGEDLNARSGTHQPAKIQATARQLRRGGEATSATDPCFSCNMVRHT